MEPLEDSKISEQCQNYTALKSSYERLAHEIQYTLDKRLREAGIKFSAVTHRTKTEESLRNKLKEESSSTPFKEVTDLAGVRIVHLYSDDFERIKEILSKEFEITEIVDKRSKQGVDKFGYLAVHFIVRLGKKSSGTRYDDLKSLKCEIQVRTVLQDAWAIINHHLTYKQEQDVPTPLLRKVNSLAGLLEAADYQFDYIRLEREQYIKEIESNKDTLMNQEINADTLVAFLKYYFPDAKKEISEKGVSNILNELDRKRYKTLRDLKTLLDKKSKEIAIYKSSTLKSGELLWSPSSIIGVVLRFEGRGGLSPAAQKNAMILFSRFYG